MPITNVKAVKTARNPKITFTSAIIAAINPYTKRAITARTIAEITGGMFVLTKDNKSAVVVYISVSTMAIAVTTKNISVMIAYMMEIGRVKFDISKTVHK